jgi:hypothetical protein
VRSTPRLVCLVLLALASTASAAEPAGVSAAVRGEVLLARAQTPESAIRSGESVFMQDVLRSGPRSGMQLLLLDETTFTIGPESELVVDEFVYDPSTGAGELGARVVKGVFRFVTGKIAKDESGNVNVALPAGNIGVRGTIVAGSADPATRSSIVVLLGEGADNDAGDPPGSIDVCNAGACVEVTRPGFGVRIDGPEFQPTPAFRVDEAAVRGLLHEVSDPAGALDALATSTADDRIDPILASGAPEERRLARRIDRELEKDDLDDELTNLASQDAVTQKEILDANLVAANGPTTFGQLRGINQGAIHYSASGVPLSSGGSYSFLMNVDLGARTFGGGASYVQVSGPQVGSQYLSNPVSYAGAQGFANFHITTSAITGAGCGTFCTGDLAVLPQNVDGQVGAAALHSLRLESAGGSPVAKGAGIAPASAGFQP